MYGGCAPYRVQFRDLGVDGSSGTLSHPCGLIREDDSGVDSQVLNVQAVVIDANGALVSAVVSTYVIAARQHAADRLRGGCTHRLEGWLMRIPEGLGFDVENVGTTALECPARTCTHADCLDSGIQICQGAWSINTIDRSVRVGGGGLPTSYCQPGGARRIGDR